MSAYLAGSAPLNIYCSSCCPYEAVVRQAAARHPRPEERDLVCRLGADSPTLVEEAVFLDVGLLGIVIWTFQKPYLPVVSRAAKSSSRTADSTS